jgi:hypothetical protein
MRSNPQYPEGGVNRLIALRLLLNFLIHMIGLAVGVLAIFAGLAPAVAGVSLIVISGTCVAEFVLARSHDRRRRNATSGAESHSSPSGSLTEMEPGLRLSADRLIAYRQSLMTAGRKVS